MSRPAVLTPAGRRPERDETIPRALIMAIGGLLLTVLVLVTLARVTGMEPQAMPRDGVVAAERYLTLTRTPDGGVIVHDAQTGETVADLGPNDAGFVGGVHRTVLFERNRGNGDPGAPVRLVRWEDGTLTLFDTSTEWRMEIFGFGDANFASFVRLMDGT